MTERQQPPGLPPAQPSDGPPDPTVPGIPLQRMVTADEPTLLGFPAEFGEDDPAGTVDDVVPVQLVSVRRADPVAGAVLVLAGVAAAASVGLPWRKGDPATGFSLVRQGLEVAGSNVRAIGPSGLWQPMAVVLGGGVLLLMGLLMFGPARTHRISGLVALVVACGAAAGVLFLVAHAGWLVARWDPGLWCAAAVALLGLLGALKAMLTPPRIRWRRPAPPAPER